MLSKQRCVPCNSQSQALTEEALQPLLVQLDGWQVVTEGGHKLLRKRYILADFQQAMLAAQQIAELAEQFDHHPALLVEWGKLTVNWWTHTIAGLHLNDFVLAAKCDDLPVFSVTGGQ
ncbi:4a-hydroxytetrahydrobiopterin dehydratase [Halioxenophilus sp. WMMB6]|uniref:4a-hydroxytetrahydrobiopterin dehydratase n=1 Tax=Halioxenophilus sp. WMMB6 TaxID=3073815 RepID=UPI00295E9A5F|nr:4a-hydroxytetrahydrobiopterin dehydratase [Halioxenophilus sp. WMMB6]